MKHTKTRNLRASAVSLAIASMLMAGSLQAGVITNSNPTPGSTFLGDCGGTAADSVACLGAWNLGNVDIELYSALDPTTSIGTVDKFTGVYPDMAPGDSFASFIKNGTAHMGRLTGKVWPVGEPVGIKAVNGDKNENGKPQNCLINTAFLDADASTSGASAYLDTTSPEPVVCSSEFQTHKRFKIAMLPATVDGVADGADGKGIDLVFDVTNNEKLTPYQVFSKINNYTGKRLKGYKIVVGQGVGDDPVTGFKSAGELGIAGKLHLSLGIGEGTADGKEKLILDGSNLFDDEGMATFSHGLFGAPDDHFTANGFFDSRTAGFNVVQTCSVTPCTTYPNPFAGGVPLVNSDTIQSTSLLASNYSGPASAPLTTPLFGAWLPSSMQPHGIFWDFDADPTTDADLVAWWDGSAWRKNFDSGFAVVSDEEFKTWAKDPLYAVDTIEDVLNLGINYIVKVGDDIGDSNADGKDDFTIRIIPVVADAEIDPGFVSTEYTPLVAAESADPVTTVSSGGGCSASTGNNPVDPVLPLLAALGLAGWGLRRARRQ